MNNKFAYPASFIKQKKVGGYVIKFLDFPEAITQAETIDIAFQEAADCLEEAIANRIEMKLEIPTPSKAKKGQQLVLVHALFAAKMALYMTMRAQKCTNAVLAKKLKCDEKEIRRLLDLHYHSKLPRIEQALYQLGKKLKIEVISVN